MSQLNFEAMSRKELRAYILEHRDDEYAFRIYMDRAIAEATDSEIYPAPQSIDDLNFPKLLEKFRRERKEKQ